MYDRDGWLGKEQDFVLLDGEESLVGRNPLKFFSIQFLWLMIDLIICYFLKYVHLIVKQSFGEMLDIS